MNVPTIVSTALSTQQASTTRSNINVGLLDQIIAKIEEEPASWDQNYYARKEPRSSCGTAFCVAGWAAVLSGAEVDWQSNFMHPEAIKGGRSIHDYAAGVLGLSDQDADALFDADNSLETIKRMRDDLAEFGYLSTEIFEEKELYLIG